MSDIICMICGFKTTDFNGLSSHLRLHKVSSKEYYDKFLKKENEGFCKTCGNPTKFGRISIGYRAHCCKECISKDSDVKYKKETHFKETYGEEFSSNLQLQSVKEKIKQTCMERYGYENPTQVPQIKDKIKETFKEKYGVESPLLLEDVKKDIYNKCEKLYGSKHCFRNLYKFDNKTFDSSWELMYYIYLKDNNINFYYHPNIEFEFLYLNKIHKYNPDFLLLDENLFVEIKGLQFFENKDSNNRMVCYYDRNKDDLYEAKHQCMIEHNVQIITNISLYKNYIIKHYGKNYLKQFKIKKKG